MNTYKFAQLSPRQQDMDANEVVFASGPVLGIEVTEKHLAARCSLGNLDHHGPDSTVETPSACMQALTCELPPRGATLATVRPDADSLTAMAVLSLRASGRGVHTHSVRGVDRRDRLGPAEFQSDVTKAIWQVAGLPQSIETRVAEIEKIVAEDTATSNETVEKISTLKLEYDKKLEAAKASSKITVNGGIAVVVSTVQLATVVGYEHGSVVVAMNPTMPVDPRDPSKGNYRKFTVCRYDSHTPCHMQSALQELKALEPGWGGRGDIFGSPQGISSTLNLDQVVEVVKRYCTGLKAGRAMSAQ